MNSKPIAFIEIFGLNLEASEQINSIEIPIIQRDYAQGRISKEVTRIRKNFIEALHTALTGNEEKAIKLDFVYGNIEEGKLIPLDGQQRLTTLFLLHWYIAKKENIAKEEQVFLKNFTYKTRFSSQHFCESLVACKPMLENENISEWIMDQNWFMYSWEKDPTIHSMLVMLDKIHQSFRNEDNLWAKLISKELLPISFYFLPLQDMGLTDSLYIKMNSRGKPLTPFEHFKAEFERIIKSVSKELYDEFTEKVDVAWVDMLWKYRDESNYIDDRFMKYYRFITEIICYNEDIEIVENDFDLASKVYAIPETEEEKSDDELKNEKEKAINNLKFLFNSFDCWLDIDNIDSFFDSIFSKESYEINKVCLFDDDTNLFAQCCNSYGDFSGKKRHFSLNNFLLLYAVNQYLVNKDNISKEQFETRIRIVRNLVTNSQNEIRESNLKILLKNVEQIITNGFIDTETKSFNALQKKEETDKIKWRSENSNLIEILNRLEDHSILQGCVAIIRKEEIDSLETRVSSFYNLFTKDRNLLKLRTALLTIGDYSQLASWRFLFANKNDNSWREIFTPSQQRKGFSNTQNILYNIIDSNSQNYSEYLDLLITNYLSDSTKLKDWKYYLIKYPKMRSGNSGVYHWTDNKDINQYQIIMMNTALSLGGKHWNPFLYSLKFDSEFKELLSLEEYNSPIIINKTNEKIKSSNDSWIILNEENIEQKRIQIPQESGIDKVDRMDLIKEYLKEKLN